jgi:CheY-like chemotaxis protein
MGRKKSRPEDYGPAQPVAAQSGRTEANSSAAHAQRASEAGFEDFVLKPVDLMTLDRILTPRAAP